MSRCWAPTASGRRRHYTAYGARILAVADGTVVSTLPDPSTITLDTVDGNHVVLDLGSFAFYAHMQPGSVRVKPGQHVRRGDVLGLLGNTGSTSAPHVEQGCRPRARTTPDQTSTCTAAPVAFAGPLRSISASPAPARQSSALTKNPLS